MAAKGCTADTWPDGEGSFHMGGAVGWTMAEIVEKMDTLDWTEGAARGRRAPRAAKVGAHTARAAEQPCATRAERGSSAPTRARCARAHLQARSRISGKLGAREASATPTRHTHTHAAGHGRGAEPFAPAPCPLSRASSQASSFARFESTARPTARASTSGRRASRSSTIWKRAARRATASTGRTTRNRSTTRGTTLEPTTSEPTLRARCPPSHH
eukprot:4987639-Prymnesium_polylepis.1